MNRKTRRNLQNKARLIRGLTNVLMYDADNIADDINYHDYEQLQETLTNTKTTLQTIMDAVIEIEYALYLDKS